MFGIENRALVIMYPDCRTTGGLPRSSNERIGSYLGDKFYEIVDKIFCRYQKQGYRVIGVTYSDTTQETFSPLYPFARFDQLIHIQTSQGSWDRDTHPSQLDSIVDRLDFPRGSKVVVGGYHAGDCVVEMIKALKRNNYQPEVNLLLTNKLGEFMVMSHEVRRILGKLQNPKERKKDILLWNMIKEEVNKLAES